MKDIDIGKEYVIPSPGYRSARERAGSEEPDELKLQQAKHKVGACAVPFLFSSSPLFLCPCAPAY